jgi:predicted MFS family arabinose efflux permease
VESTLNEKIYNRGWIVTLAGLFINLALGILYAWSVLKDSIFTSIKEGGENAFNWSEASLNDPYAVCILIFAFSMIFAGKLQDKKGPLITAFIGGLLVGSGFILASLSKNYYLWILGFGILAGTGIGFGYSAVTPAALKWFPSNKTGLIAGIVVSGFGLAPVYIAPLATYFVNNYGLERAILIFGILFILVVCGFSLLLKNPDKDFVIDKSINLINKSNDFETIQMLKSPIFYLLWIIFFISSGAGLMVIGSISGLAKLSMGKSAFIAVAIMAFGNASGRIIAGIVSDKIGKVLTLFIILIFQTILMFFSLKIIGIYNSSFIIVFLATFIGFNYGTNLSLFPAFTKSFWGLKNFGVNFGIMMSAWGVGGFVFSRISQTLFAKNGNHNFSFIIAGYSLLLSIFLIYFLNKKEKSLVIS